jgi:hypothetical protein
VIQVKVLEQGCNTSDAPMCSHVWTTSLGIIKRHRQQQVMPPLLAEYHYNSWGGNEKLPPSRFSMVGIVDEFCQAPTQLPPQKSSPWCAICLSYGVNSMDLPSSMHGRPYAGVGWGRCRGVLYESNLDLFVFSTNRPICCYKWWLKRHTLSTAGAHIIVDGGCPYNANRHDITWF